MDPVHTIRGYVRRWWERGRAEREENAAEAARGRSDSSPLQDDAPGGRRGLRNALGATTVACGMLAAMLGGASLIRFLRLPVQTSAHTVRNT